jgi:hypothetical protein
MPLRCINSLTGESIIAFDLKDDAWDALGVVNRRDRHLRTVCCGTKVALKRSAWKTKFFAHMPKLRCKAPLESEAHLRLKQMVVEVAREHGWKALTEVSGDRWRADVLATKGCLSVGVEVQWSRQTSDVTHERQERFRQAGIRCLWLFKQSDFPIGEELPAARIVREGRRRYVALVPNYFGEQRFEVREFLDPTFAGRLHFGFPVGIVASATLGVVKMACPLCETPTAILRTLTVRCVTSSALITIADLDAYPEEANMLRELARSLVPIGKFDRRYYANERANRLQNTCAHCGASLGRLRQYEKSDGNDVGVVLEIQITPGWRQLLKKSEKSSLYWGVYT